MSKTLRIPLVRIAHARSGDKADWVDFGLFAWNEAGYRIMAAGAGGCLAFAEHPGPEVRFARRFARRRRT